MSKKKIISDVVCPFCGSLCDDIEVIMENDTIKEVKNACQLGATKIRGNRNSKRLTKPLIKIKEEFVE
ncbi:MAG: formylmethanofuran dehydrogenase subunit B, partial [Candidatus Heimdallarchaeota archaeon]